jgi:hypothetical protein
MATFWTWTIKCRCFNIPVSYGLVEQLRRRRHGLIEQPRRHRHGLVEQLSGHRRGNFSSIGREEDTK